VGDGFASGEREIVGGRVQLLGRDAQLLQQIADFAHGRFHTVCRRMRRRDVPSFERGKPPSRRCGARRERLCESVVHTAACFPASEACRAAFGAVVVSCGMYHSSGPVRTLASAVNARAICHLV
jgi:hypothetical protein